jgi:hypothetical protein
MPFESLGDFRLVERLHLGPRAEVWAAEGPDGQRVAMKIVIDAIARRAGFVTIFEKETSPLLLMHHPNVLPCRARGAIGSRFFVVQPLVTHTLRAVLRRGPLAAHAAVRMGIDVCSALEYAHCRAIAHRNVVAENVFVEADGKGPSRVGDFGWSLLSGPPPAEATSDVRSDLHQLASLVYEAIAGRSPAATPSSLVGRIDGVDARFDSFFAAALATDPSRRFRRASEMSLALSLLLPRPKTDPPAAELVTVDFGGANALLRLRAGVTATVLHGAHQEIERAMRRGAQRCAVAYDLGELTLMEDAVKDMILSFVTRNRPSIARIAFASPRAMVRASALVVAQRAGIPSKIFAGIAPMHGWLEGGGS